MISTMQELEEACVFEQAVLAVSFPLINPNETVIALDVRVPGDTISHHVFRGHLFFRSETDNRPIPATILRGGLEGSRSCNGTGALSRRFAAQERQHAH